MTILGLTDVNTEKEIGEEIYGHEDRQWLRECEDLSSGNVPLGRGKLKGYYKHLSELKGLELEGYLSDDSCGWVAEDEWQKFLRMTPDGKPLPLHNNLILNVELPDAKKKKRNKKKNTDFKCQPCEATGMASYAPLTKTHYRTHMPKHPDCEICRLTKPQASPRPRISDKRKKAFGKVDDEGNLITINRPAGARKLPEHFGDLVTADHMTTIDEDEQSWLKDSVALSRTKPLTRSGATQQNTKMRIKAPKALRSFLGLAKSQRCNCATRMKARN